MKLDELVRRRRAERNLSIREVARRGKMPFTTVHDVESGKSADVKVSTLLGLGKALALRPAMLMEAARESLNDE